MTFLLDNVGKLTAVHAVDREIIKKLLKRPDSIKFTSCFANQHTSQTARTLLQSLLSVLFPYLLLFSLMGLTSALIWQFISATLKCSTSDNVCVDVF